MPIFESQNGVVTAGSSGTGSGGSGGGTLIDIQDEGNSVGTFQSINFVGKNVTALSDSANSRANIDVPLEDVYCFECYKDLVVNNVWLKSNSGFFLNANPFLISVNSEIFHVSFKSKIASSFSLELYKDADIVNVPNHANAIYVMNVSNLSMLISGSLSIFIPSGTKLGVYIRGATQDIYCSVLLRRV